MESPNKNTSGKRSRKSRQDSIKFMDARWNDKILEHDLYFPIEIPRTVIIEISKNIAENFMKNGENTSIFEENLISSLMEISLGFLIKEAAPKSIETRNNMSKKQGISDLTEEFHRIVRLMDELNSKIHARPWLNSKLKQQMNYANIMFLEAKSTYGGQMALLKCSQTSWKFAFSNMKDRIGIQNSKFLVNELIIKLKSHGFNLPVSIENKWYDQARHSKN